MSLVELESIEVDSKKAYAVKDSVDFKITLNVHEDLEEDIEFEIKYFGDAYSEAYDQTICKTMVGPLEAGKQFFHLETEPIDITKLPIKILFGVTTMLIMARYKSQEFMRIGYILSVSHKGVDCERLMESSENEELEGEENEELEGEESEEDVEVMGDEELDGEENEESEDDSEDGSEDAESEDDDDENLVTSDDDDECSQEGECCHEGGCCHEGECSHEEECDDGHDVPQIGEFINRALTTNRKPIPLETPIVADKDDFEYKGIQMKQSKIVLELLEKPIIHLYEIAWKSTSEKGPKEGEVVESSEEDASEAGNDADKVSPIESDKAVPIESGKVAPIESDKAIAAKSVDDENNSNVDKPLTSDNDVECVKKQKLTEN